VRPTGDLPISYDFQYTGPDVHAREIGLRFAVPLTVDGLTWKRRGERTCYPDDHIAALEGSALGYSGRPAISPPDWPDGEDDSPLGTAAFPSTKRNITLAALQDEQGRGISTHSKGAKHFRAAVESDRIAVFVNDWFAGTSARAREWTENYGDGKLLRSGDRISGKRRVYISWGKERVGR
jgi:beta-galactosidase